MIYSFVYLMIYFCARGNEQAYAVELAKKDPHHGAHLIPLKWCFKPWPLGDVFLFRCKVRRPRPGPFPTTMPIDQSLTMALAPYLIPRLELFNT